MFVKAERKKAKLKLAITGPSGSGKTFSALRLASGLGGPIAVVDTENGSAALYSDRFDFSVVNLTPPYSIDKYLKAIDAAHSGGFNVLILDSISHAWAGEGGILDQKATIDERGGNQFRNWKKPKELQSKLKGALLNSDIHIIATLRSKQAYEIQEVEGKKTPKKLGLDPIQEPGFEYEFTCVFNVGMDHKCEVSKDRTGLFVDKLFQVSEESGKLLARYLGENDRTRSVGSDERSQKLSPSPSERNKSILSICAERKIPTSKVAQILKTELNKTSLSELTDDEFTLLTETLRALNS